MTRLTAPACLVLAVLGLLAARALPAPAAADVGVPHQGTPAPGSCIAAGNKTAHPGVVELGQTVQVSLVLTATCGAAPGRALHLVLLIDGSSTGGKIGPDVQDRLVELVRHLDLAANPSTRVGVVEYDSLARIRCELTNNESRAVACIGQVQFVGPTRTDLGIQEARRVLLRGRSANHGERDNVTEVMLITQGRTPDNGCDPSMRAAGAAKAAGTIVIAVPFGIERDMACARQLATSVRFAIEFTDWDQIIAIFGTTADSPGAPHPDSAVVTDTLPANVEYVADSARPPAQVLGSQIVWTGLRFPTNTMTLTFGVRPLQVGRWPTNVRADARVTYWGHPDTAVVFPVPEVDVVRPDPTETASPAPSPTDEPQPTVTGAWSWREVYLPALRLE